MTIYGVTGSIVIGDGDPDHDLRIISVTEGILNISDDDPSYVLAGVVTQIVTEEDIEQLRHIEITPMMAAELFAFGVITDDTARMAQEGHGFVLFQDVPVSLHRFGIPEQFNVKLLVREPAPNLLPVFHK